MNDFVKRAEELFDEMVRNRRYLHENAETGMVLPKTVKYVKKELIRYGYDPKMIGGGITCTVGKGERTLLLRADMDALPQEEISGLPFACKTGACHSCGHDFHTTMLLAAAKMLKERENELPNTIKLLFQPGEEVLQGAKAMIREGILENPRVDCAYAMHCLQYDSGSIVYRYGSTRGACAFMIRIHGKSCHGARPYEGVSAAVVAADILLSVQRLVSAEMQPKDENVISFGSIQAGTVSNIVPGEAVLMGSIRSYDNQNTAYMKDRLIQIVQNIATANRASAEVVFDPEVGSLKNDKEMVDEFSEYLRQVTPNCVERQGNDPGTEDFAAFGEFVPSMLANIGVGSIEEGYIYGSHNPKRTLDEKAMIHGAACYANCAYQWANHH